MKSAVNQTTLAVDTTVLSTAIRQSYNMYAQPRLRADWNLNRYVIPTANNIPAISERVYDENIFPIASIIEPVRPNKGSAKAIIGQSIVSGAYSKQNDPHFYVGDDEDTYKYWVSPDKSDGTATMPLYSDGQTTCRPYVLYPSVLKANKVVLRFENTWASPKTYKIRTRSTVFTTGNITLGWTQIGSNIAPAADGTVTLYYNGTAWVTTRPATLVTTDVAGIQIAVDVLGGGFKKDGTATTYTKRTTSTAQPTQYTTDGKNSYLSLISMEAHYEADLTSRMITVEDTFDNGDVSQLYPLGTITTNVGNLTFSNEDSMLNNENAASPFYKLMEPNVEFNLEYVFDLSGVKYAVQQFKMYGGAWAGQYADTVTVSLEDSSKFLKELKPRATMYENKTVPEIVWRVLDSVGFTNYQIDESDLVTNHQIPVWWTDGTLTVWEILNDLASGTQTAIYFDGNNKLQVKTREAAFTDTATPAWTLYGQPNGAILPDISEFDNADEFEANNVDVKFKDTKWRVGTEGDPALGKVWEPEDQTLVVRSAPLKSTFTTSATAFFLNTADIAIWPYASKVNIDGEVLSYEGKQFVYTTYTTVVDPTTHVVSYTTPVKHYVKVKSDDEKNKYNAMTPPDFQSKNYLSGAVYIKDRGLYGTVNSNHSVDVAGWTTKSEYVRGATSTRNSPVAIFTRNANSTVTLTGGYHMRDAADTFWVSRGLVADTTFRRMGTRMRFRTDASHSTQRGGIAFEVSNTRMDGYYVELRPTSTISAKDAPREAEVMIYSRKSGKYATLALGARVAIVKDMWYDVDVYYSPGAGAAQDYLSVWVNGQRVAAGYTTTATKQIASGQFSMYGRGKSIIDYEYFYGANTARQEPADDFGYFDLVYGGTRGQTFIREYVYQLKTRVVKINKKNVTQTYKLNDYIFDEFGPYVHEVREFDVKFDPKPVQYSSLFSTNSWYSAILDYRSTPFGAKFTIANVARFNAVIHGEDSLMFNSAENTVNQVCTVLGRDLVIADEESVNVKNLEAIRARGQIDSELSSDWLQTKAMAQDVATWMTKHWSEGLDTFNVTIYGNPLLEIGDVVSIDYARKSMTPTTHKYFVTGTSSSFKDGLQTTLNLRRVRTSVDASLVTSP